MDGDNLISFDTAKGGEFCVHGNFVSSCKICTVGQDQKYQLTDSDGLLLEEKETEAWLEEIEHAEPSIEWKTYVPERQFGVIILLNVNDAGERSMYIDIFQVHPRLRGKNRGDSAGIGSRLLTSLVSEARKYEVSTLGGHFTSKSALATQARVCGRESLNFFKHGTSERVEKTFEEVMAENDPDNPGRIDYDVVSTL